MQNASVTRIFDTARLRLPGATDGVMQLEFMNTVQDFCVATSAWIDATDVELEPNVNLYDLVPPDANGDIKRIMYVENLDREAPRWTAPAWMPVPGVMQIGFVPQARQDIVVYVALQPNELGCKQGIPGDPGLVLHRIHPGAHRRPGRQHAGAAGEALLEPADGAVLPQALHLG